MNRSVLKTKNSATDPQLQELRNKLLIATKEMLTYLNHSSIALKYSAADKPDLWLMFGTIQELENFMKQIPEVEAIHNFEPTGTPQ